MSNEEFEDLFGNTPFENIEKIKKYINENYVSKSKIKDKTEELEEEADTTKLDLNTYEQRLAQIDILQELLNDKEEK